MNGFMYGNVYDDNDRFERQAVFPKLLCNNAEDFSLVSAGLIDFYQITALHSAILV